MNEIDFFQDDEQTLEQGFVIDTQEKAEWALRKCSTAEARIAENTQIAQALKARIDARLAQINAQPERTLESMTELLRPYAETEVAKGGKAKSVKLLCGTLGFRTAPASVVVTDETAALAWLEANGHAECIRTKREVSKSEVKALITAKGEVPEGIELKAGDTRFYVETEPLEIEKKAAI